MRRVVILNKPAASFTFSPMIKVDQIGCCSAVDLLVKAVALAVEASVVRVAWKAATFDRAA